MSIAITNPTFLKDGVAHSLHLGTIERTTLGYEDHGIFTVYLMLDFGDSGQGAGGYCLDSPLKDADNRYLGRVGTAYGLDFILQTLKVVGVSEWDHLKGKHVYAIRKESYGEIVGLAHVKNPRSNAFFFADHADRWKDATATVEETFRSVDEVQF